MRPTLAAEVAARARLDQARLVLESECYAYRRMRRSGRAPTEEQRLRIFLALDAEADAETAWLEARERERAS